MILIKKYLIIGFVLVCDSLLFAQFNTLIHKEIKFSEISDEKQILQDKASVRKENVKKNIIRRFFDTPTKADLKTEIDSLKKVMLVNLVKAEKSAPLNNHTDSQIDDGTSIHQENLSSEKSIRKFKVISEEEFRSKISMPLHRDIVVTSPFGNRIHPILGMAKMHMGTDLKAHYENVYAVLDGVVIASGWDSGGGGNYIKIKHPGSFETSYLHLSETYYKAGESVKAGFIIAKSGNTGNSTGAHLHFAVTEQGKYINPIRFLNDLIKANNLIASYYESE